MDSLVALLGSGLQDLDLPVSDVQTQHLARLALLLEQWAARINLTAHRSADAIARRLILDAAGLSKAIGPTPDLADLGSGAGFPGLPIAILAPETSVVLVESRERRHHFQRAAVRDLQLENARPLHGRAERLEPIPCQTVVAQAVASAADLAVLMRPWCRRGGKLVFPGSIGAAAPGPDLGLRDVRRVDYRVPLGGPDRTLWLAGIP